MTAKIISTLDVELQKKLTVKPVSEAEMEAINDAISQIKETLSAFSQATEEISQPERIDVFLSIANGE